jgi:hypothetical protein
MVLQATGLQSANCLNLIAKAAALRSAATGDVRYAKIVVGI